MTHTPGPWLFEPAEGMQEFRRAGYVDGNGSHRVPIADIIFNGDYKTGQDNGHLITAAPDLLAALEILLPVAEAFEKQSSGGSRRGGPVFAQARAAIAKTKEQ